MNPTTDVTPAEQLVTTMSERMATLTRTLSTWMQEQPHSLAEVEQHVVRLLKEIGATLVAGLCPLAAPADPSPSVACSCGQGMQIGSGTVESACKQLVSTRHKQAGMIWEAGGAEAVAVVRAWLKSERWEEAMALRGVRSRSYRRGQAEQEREGSEGKGQAVEQAGRRWRHKGKLGGRKCQRKCWRRCAPNWTSNAASMRGGGQAV